VTDALRLKGEATQYIVVEDGQCPPAWEAHSTYDVSMNLLFVLSVYSPYSTSIDSTVSAGGDQPSSFYCTRRACFSEPPFLDSCLESFGPHETGKGGGASVG
jgi:hypothetical protein